MTSQVPRDDAMTPEVRRFLDKLARDAAAVATAASLYLLKADNLSDLADAATAFTNIKQAASDTTTGVVELAIQAEMEAGTDVERAVVPGRQHFHPSAVKAWAKFVADGVAGAATISASYNVTGVNKDGTGDYTITIDTNFSSGDYVVQISYLNAGGPDFRLSVITQAAGTFTIKSHDSAGSDGDPEQIYFVCYGDQ